jgi:hypothetical protein
MTIMVAGGLTFAIPGVMPEAMAANANLYVSAENSQFENRMSGPQVIEVVIIDSDINETNESNGEPDVTINGAKLRMAQATDGNWYGYFADKTQAIYADATSQDTEGGYGLDFGQFCGSASTSLASDQTTQIFSDTVGVAIPIRSNGTATTFGANGTANYATGVTALPTCSTTFHGYGSLPGAAFWDGPGTDTRISANSTYSKTNDVTSSSATVSTGVEKTVQNVVREAKKINTNTATGNGVGQIGLIDDGIWPFIQLYNLTTGGDVNIQYNKGGGVQTTTLTFDTADDLASWSLDRSKYPLATDVHLTISDLWLNIDPTDEDSWTFDTSGSSYATYYQMFDENGAAAGNASPNAINLQSTDFVDGAGTAANQLTTLMGKDVVLKIAGNPQGKGATLIIQDNGNNVIGGTETLADSTSGVITAGGQPVTITETGPATGVFVTYDESDVSTLATPTDSVANRSLRGTTATITYNDDSASMLIGFEFGSIDIQAPGDEWGSGEEIPVVLLDNDLNKNSRIDEDISVKDPTFTIIPSLITGDPFTLSEGSNTSKAIYFDGLSLGAANAVTVTTQKPLSDDMSVDSFSKVGRLPAINANGNVDGIIIDYQTTLGDLRSTLIDTSSASLGRGVNMLNLDVRSLNETSTVSVYLLNSTGSILSGTGSSTILGAQTIGANLIATGLSTQSLNSINGTTAFNTLISEIKTSTSGGTADANDVGLLILLSDTTNTEKTTDGVNPIVADFFSFGFTSDGYDSADRKANQIVRLELEETGDNTGEFVGSLEYVMINQVNILSEATYTGLTTISDEVSFVAIEDLTDEDAPRVNYLDLGADGVATQVADQEAAPTHDGIVSLDNSNYKVADTVTVTLEDMDLNTDSELIDIFTVVTETGNTNYDVVGSVANGRTSLSDGTVLTRMLDITFDDEIWKKANQGSTTCSASSGDDGLAATGFTLVETGVDTGVFVGDFQIPSTYCARTGASAGSQVTTTGKDIEVNYVDFRDHSGETIEVGDGAGVRANTGSVTLDRTVYPVPFGTLADFNTNSAKTPTNANSSERSLFPIHETGIDGSASIASGEYLANGDLTIHVRVNDPDFDVSASGEDTIASNSTSGVGPVKISVIRGSSSVVLGHAGGPAALDGKIATAPSTYAKGAVQFGPMTEIAPDAGIFEADITVRYTDGPVSATDCPATDVYTGLNGTSRGSRDVRFDTQGDSSNYHCILQGDILQVEYTDPTDASGDVNTVTDSATFDLRNGVLQSDKSVYIIGSDIILTLIEPDFDLDNDAAETYDLDLIEWDSDAFNNTIGDEGDKASSFDPEPSDFRETGDSTGIFQVVLEMPATLTSALDRGEQIDLEYTDWGPSGADFVGAESEDVNITIYTSNFGATVELDQKVYSWTDKVYITIVAPDHNYDSNLVDEIGNTSDDPIKVTTRGYTLNKYKLVETGTDTGIFTGEVILTGFNFDADGDPATGNSSGYDVTTATATGSGPTGGKLPTTDDDGLTVSFEFSEDETVVGSALIRWNIGEVQWLEASYPASGTGVIRVIDPDMNWNPESVDNFKIDVYSDSDAGGIDLTVTETNEATGIFEGTVFFTVSDESSGHRLRVAEGDTVTGEYEDNTLPDPYTTADEINVTATTLIGTVVPPLERAPAANLRTVDAFGNSLDTVSVDQQVQISADLSNGQDREQAFAYLVQIQDENGVTVSLAWITGSLSAGQSFSPALSWIPSEAGTYTATAFVWESVDNPTALSPPVSTTVNVR